jgi:hypothetical protein
MDSQKVLQSCKFSLQTQQKCEVIHTEHGVGFTFYVYIKEETDYEHK